MNDKIGKVKYCKSCHGKGYTIITKPTGDGKKGMDGMITQCGCMTKVVEKAVKQMREEKKSNETEGT
jgi:hypothetical protein